MEHFTLCGLLYCAQSYGISSEVYEEVLRRDAAAVLERSEGLCEGCCCCTGGLEGSVRGNGGGL